MGATHIRDLAHHVGLGMTFALDIVAPARGVAGRVVGRSGYRRRSVYARWIRLLRVRVRPDGPYALVWTLRVPTPQLYGLRTGVFSRFVQVAIMRDDRCVFALFPLLLAVCTVRSKLGCIDSRYRAGPT